MPFRGVTLDREFDKFKAVGNETAVRIADEARFAAPPEADSFQVDYPSNTQVVYTFYQGVTLLRTVTLTYTNAAKDELESGVVT